MAAASSHFRRVCEEDVRIISLIEAILEKTKITTKYGVKIFHGEKRSRNKRPNDFILHLLLIYTFKSWQFYNFDAFH